MSGFPAPRQGETGMGHQAAQPPGITLACKITIGRFLAVPLFVLLLIYYTEGLAAGQPNEYLRAAALAVFLLATLSDALDGYIARSRKEITRLGTILDPLADKAILLSALVLLTRPSLKALQPQFPVAYTLVVISRDAFLIAGAFVIDHYAGRVHVRPRLPGKAATFFQMVVVVWVLAPGPRQAFGLLIWIAGFFTVLSGLMYFADGLRQIEAAEHERHGRG